MWRVLQQLERDLTKSEQPERFLIAGIEVRRRIQRVVNCFPEVTVGMRKNP